MDNRKREDNVRRRIDVLHGSLYPSDVEIEFSSQTGNRPMDTRVPFVTSRHRNQTPDFEGCLMANIPGPSRGRPVSSPGQLASMNWELKKNTTELELAQKAAIATATKLPSVGTNGVPDIPFLVFTDHMDVKEAIIEAWKNPDKEKAMEIISTKLRRIFRASTNPFSDGLFFMVHSPDFRTSTGTTSLAHQVLLVLFNWLMEREMVSFQRMILRPELQMAAFMIVTLHGGSALISLVAEIYRLDFIREYLTVPVLDLCKKGLYKEACLMATYVEITDGISVHDFVIPLILQDRDIIANEYLADHSEIQKQLIVFLEEMNAETDLAIAMKDYCMSRSVVNFKSDKFERKSFEKVFTRYVNKYKIVEKPKEPEIPTKPVLDQKCHFETALQGELRKIDWTKLGGMSMSSPSDSTYDFEKFAAKQTYKGRPIKSIFTDMNEKSNVWDNKSPEVSDYDFSKYTSIRDNYPFEIGKEAIHYLNSPDGVEVFLKNLRAAQIIQKRRSNRHDDFLVVTFDVKWRIVGKRREGACILVIGIMDEIFIIDVLRLKNYINHPDESWEILNTFFFLSHEIVKIGYNKERIFGILAKTTPHWANIGKDFKLFVDLNVIANRLMLTDDRMFPGAKLDIPYGLKELVRASFRMNLTTECDKYNWERRPLKEKLLHYAAIDGVAIIHVLAFMEVRSYDLSINFEKIVINAFKSDDLPSDYFFSIAGRTRIFPADIPFANQMSPNSFKVVCDKTLKALATQLRGIGMDCVYLGPEDDVISEFLRLAFSEDRHIITSEATAEELRPHLPDNRCCPIAYATKIEQLKEVMDFFNISVNDSDIYTRCQTCNGDQFIAVKRITMCRLFSMNKRAHDENPAIQTAIIPLVPKCDVDLHKAKKWNLSHSENLMIDDPKNIRTASGAPIYFNSINPGHLRHVVTFLICNDCGFIYMDENTHDPTEDTDFGKNSTISRSVTKPQVPSSSKGKSNSASKPFGSKKSSKSMSVSRPSIASSFISKMSQKSWTGILKPSSITRLISSLANKSVTAKVPSTSGRLTSPPDTASSSRPSTSKACDTCIAASPGPSSSTYFHPAERISHRPKNSVTYEPYRPQSATGQRNRFAGRPHTSPSLTKGFRRFFRKPDKR